MIIAKQSRLVASPKALLQVSKHLDIPTPRKSLRTVTLRNCVVQDELSEARGAWKQYQSTRRRDAIYKYLSAVFEVVRRWKQQGCVKNKVHQALMTMENPTAIRKQDPFATVIFCTSDSRAVDTKMRSKWSRALRIVDCRLSPKVASPTSFIKRRGGINNVLLNSQDLEERRY